MFEQSSRYYTLETLKTSDGDSRIYAYKARRFLPQGETMTLLVEVSIGKGDRLDFIAHETLGDPEQFWRICDANNAMNPFALTAEPGQKLRVPIPEF